MPRLLMFCLVAGAVGCNGVIGDAPAKLQIDPPGTFTAAQCNDGSIHPGPAPLRRLTRVEYDNTIRLLTGDATQPARAGLATDVTDPNGFDTEARMQSVNAASAESFESVAETVAARAVRDARAKLLPCDPQNNATACGATFVASFGTRAFRRPLTADENSRYSDFFESARGSYDFDTAMRMTIEAMLQAPQFLYRVENVPAGSAVGDVVLVDDFAMASRLSYAITRSMPDDTLMAAARAGALSTAEGIETEARRLLGTEEARVALHDFFDQWLRIAPVTAIAKADPRFTTEIGAAMVEETHRFIDDVVWNQPNALETMLTGTYSFVNGPLADFYGLEGIDGDAFQRVELDPTVRKGVLTRAAWLTVNATNTRTKPVTRGVFLKREILCDALGDPPPAASRVVDNTDASGKPRSVRDAFDAHLATPSCAACHTSVDPLGFAFEEFGAVGELRSNDDNGFVLDTTGVIATSDMTGAEPTDDEAQLPFTNAADLLTQLARSEKVVQCMISQQLEFNLGRAAVTEDLCTRQTIEAAWKGSGYDFQELLVAVVRSDAFRYRRVTDSDL